MTVQLITELLTTELHTFGERCPTCASGSGRCALVRITWLDVPPPEPDLVIGIDWGSAAADATAAVVARREGDGSLTMLYSGPIEGIPADLAGRRVAIEPLEVKTLAFAVPQSPEQIEPTPLPPWRGERWRRDRRRR